MSTCKVPNCYQTKNNECIKPNAWITFLSTLKNKQINNTPLTISQKKKLYKIWLNKYQINNNHITDKNAYYGSLCLKSNEETRKSKPSKFSKQYTISEQKKNTNILTSDSINFMKLYSILIPNWKDDNNNNQDQLQQQQNNYIFHKYLFKPITQTNYLNCDIHSLVARGNNAWVYFVQEKQKKINRFYIGKVQLIGEKFEEIITILSENNITELYPITNIAYQKELAYQQKLYEIIQFKPDLYHFTIPRIHSHTILKTNYESIQLGTIFMDCYSPEQYDKVSWNQKLSHYYDNPTNQNYLILHDFVQLTITFLVDLHTKCSFTHGNLHLSNIFLSQNPEKKHVIIDFSRACDLLKETNKTLVINSILYDYYCYICQFHNENKIFSQKEEYKEVNRLLQDTLRSFITMVSYYYYKPYFTSNQLESLYTLFNWNLERIDETIQQHQLNYQQLSEMNKIPTDEPLSSIASQLKLTPEHKKITKNVTFNESKKCIRVNRENYNIGKENDKLIKVNDEIYNEASRLQQKYNRGIGTFDKICPSNMPWLTRHRINLFNKLDRNNPKTRRSSKIKNLYLCCLENHKNIDNNTKYYKERSFARVNNRKLAEDNIADFSAYDHFGHRPLPVTDLYDVFDLDGNKLDDLEVYVYRKQRNVQESRRKPLLKYTLFKDKKYTEPYKNGTLIEFYKNYRKGSVPKPRLESNKKNQEQNNNNNNNNTEK